MGRTFKRNDRWKKDRRDKHIRESKKFRDVQHDYQHRDKPNNTKLADDPVVEEDLGSV